MPPPARPRIGRFRPVALCYVPRMPTGCLRDRVAVVGSTAAILCSLACSPTDPKPPLATFELPNPDLSTIDPAVREQLEKKSGDVAGLLEDDAAPSSQLAESVGELGNLYHSYNLLSVAEECYREASARAPDDPRWPYYLGFLAQIRGRWVESVEHFERVLTLDPEDPPALLRLAEVRLETGDSERARELYERAGAQEPAGAAASAGLARIAAEAGEHGAAVLHLEQALARQPEATSLHHRLATAYRALGDTEAERSHRDLAGTARVGFPDPLIARLDRQGVGSGRSLVRGGVALAEGRLDAAIAEYRRAVRQDPGDLSARLNLGLVLAQQGDPEAETHLREAVALGPRNAVAHHALGRVLSARSEAPEARRLFLRALELDPAYEAAHYHLGELEATEGRHQEAVAAFTSALEINSQSSPPRLGRALSLLALERPAQAADDLQAVLDSGDDDEAMIRLKLGEALQRAGDLDQALIQYETAARGGLPPQLRAAAELSAGNLLFSRGERDAARAHLEAAVDSDPQLGPAHFNLAGILLLDGETERALTHYRRAAEIEPDALQPKLHLGQTLLRTGHAREAVEVFDQVLAVDPWHEGALLGRATARVRQKQYTAALSDLEAALSERPGSVALAHSLARLLATCPDPALRDGDRAVTLALQVMSVDRRFEHAETVAMSMAEAGRFEEAVRWQGEVLRQAQNAPPERRAELEANLARYRAGQACCA